MRKPLTLIIPLLLLTLAVVGCGPSDDSDSEPIPDISASYSFATYLQDNECITLDFWQVFAFANDNGNGLPVFSAELEQVGAELSATLALPDCSLAGDVSSGGGFALSGACNDDGMNRTLSLSGVAEVDGLGWAVEEGGLVIDVTVAGDDGGSDGAVECSVVSDIQGSGT